MEFTEEHIAILVTSVGEERRAEVLESFRNLRLLVELLNQQQGRLEQLNEQDKLGFDSFRTGIVSMSVAAGILARPSTCEHTLNPAIWSDLPLDVQQLVFARLPLQQIIRLRVLSKTWDQHVTGAIPGFTKVCANVNPNLFGILSGGHGDYYDVAVRVHDFDLKRWLTFSHTNPIDEDVETMCAGDGGLVCLVSLDKNKQKHPLRILVFNPLTGQERELPELPHALSLVQPSMVQLVMDRDTKCYKVLVVGPSNLGNLGGDAASVFSSVTGQWSSARDFDNIIFGYKHIWEDDGDEEENNQFFVQLVRRPCAYDCANGHMLYLLDGRSPMSVLPGEKCYALVKDRLFVLHKETYEHRDFNAAEGEFQEMQRYCISEYRYQAQRRRSRWVKLRVHRCRLWFDGFEDPPIAVLYHMYLYACNGFLLVTANNGENWGFRHHLTWVYDLFKGKWEILSGLRTEFDEGGPDELGMFELQWDAVP